MKHIIELHGYMHHTEFMIFADDLRNWWLHSNVGFDGSLSIDTAEPLANMYSSLLPFQTHIIAPNKIVIEIELYTREIYDLFRLVFGDKYKTFLVEENLESSI